MDEVKIQEINETIAGAMGWTGFTKKRTEHDIVLAHPPGEKTAWSSDWPNSYISIYDAFAALNAIIPRDKRIFIAQYSKYWKCSIWKGGRVENSWSGEAETPEAAISLALVEFIKEK